MFSKYVISLAAVLVFLLAAFLSAKLLYWFLQKIDGVQIRDCKAELTLHLLMVLSTQTIATYYDPSGDIACVLYLLSLFYICIFRIPAWVEVGKNVA